MLPLALRRVELHALLERWRWVLAYTARRDLRAVAAAGPRRAAAGELDGGTADRRGAADRGRALPAHRHGRAPDPAPPGRARPRLCRRGRPGRLRHERRPPARRGRGAGRRPLLRYRTAHRQPPAGRSSRPERRRRLAAITAAVYAPFGLAQLPASVSSETIAAVVALALVCTALAFVLFFALIVEVGPARATVITYVNPLVAVLLGVCSWANPSRSASPSDCRSSSLGSVLATSRSPGHGAPASRPGRQCRDRGRSLTPPPATATMGTKTDQHESPSRIRAEVDL